MKAQSRQHIALSGQNLCNQKRIIARLRKHLKFCSPIDGVFNFAALLLGSKSLTVGINVFKHVVKKGTQSSFFSKYNLAPL